MAVNETFRPRSTIQRWVDQGVQYQLFPEDFFTGADVTIHIGDTWVDDLTAISFTLSEKVLPIYGYGSRSFDAIARGTRIVTGQFAIAFREAGYLFSILDRLGQDPYLKPKLAHLMDKENTGGFPSKAKQRIEDILAMKANQTVKRDPYNDPWNLSAMNMPVIRRGYVDQPKLFQWDQAIKGCSDLWFGVDRVYKRGEYTDAENTELKDYVHQAAERIRAHNYEDAIPLLGTFWSRVDEIGKDTTRTVPVAPVSTKWLKETANATNNLIRKGMVEFEGPVQITKKQLSSRGYYFGPIDGTFDDEMVRAVIKFQQDNDILPANGEVTKETRIALFYASYDYTQGYSRTGNWKASQQQALAGAKYRWAQYEAEVWGRGEEVQVGDTSIRNDFARKYEPYFYRGDGQAKLLTRGFDIFLTYGPLAEDAEIAGGVDGRLGFNSTVKAIRNVQLMSVDTRIIADEKGQPILEVYSFVAEDLD